MKKLVLFILPLVALTFASCNDDGGSDNGKNSITIGTKSYDILSGSQIFNANNMSDTRTQIPLYFIFDNEGVEMQFRLWMLTPPAKTELVAGTYKIETGYFISPWSLNSYMYVYTTDDDPQVFAGAVYLTEGTATVKKSGDVYSIEINGKQTSGGAAFKLNYKGKLTYVNATPVVVPE